MVSFKESRKLKRILRSRRDEIFRLRDEKEHLQDLLFQPEIKTGETVSFTEMPFYLDVLDEREASEVRAIDRALGKLESGTYGYCETCGNAIPVNTLEALPCSALCNGCSQKNALPKRETSVNIPVPEEFTGLLNGNLAATVQDRLLKERRVSTEALRISADGEKLFVEGYVPSKLEKKLLLDTLKNRMGLRNIVEHVIPDPLQWQREKRTKRIKKAQQEEYALFDRCGADCGISVIPEYPQDNLIQKR